MMHRNLVNAETPAALRCTHIRLGHVDPHLLRRVFIMAALDAGVRPREVQLAARRADPRTTKIYDHRRQNLETPPTPSSPSSPSGLRRGADLPAL